MGKDETQRRCSAIPMIISRLIASNVPLKSSSLLKGINKEDVKGKLINNPNVYYDPDNDTFTTANQHVSVLLWQAAVERKSAVLADVLRETHLKVNSAEIIKLIAEKCRSHTDMSYMCLPGNDIFLSKKTKRDYILNDFVGPEDNGATVLSNGDVVGDHNLNYTFPPTFNDEWKNAVLQIRDDNTRTINTKEYIEMAPELYLLSLNKKDQSSVYNFCTGVVKKRRRKRVKRK